MSKTDGLVSKFKKFKDNDSFQKLQKIYGGLIIHYALEMHMTTKKLNEDLEDCIQILWLCFLKCIDKFDEKKEKSFVSFLVVCFNSKIKNHIRDLKRKNGNLYPVSIDSKLKENDNFSYVDILEDKDGSLEKQYELNEAVDSLYQTIDINDFERQVFVLYLYGYGYKEIGEILNCSVKKIDNTIKKVKEVLKKLND